MHPLKAIVLLSGGLDSAVMLALALEQEKECFALSFDYGQRHRVELRSALALAQYYGVSHKILTIPSHFSSSSLLENSPAQNCVPKGRSTEKIANEGIPSTYVPARNALFLAFAMGQAEILEADEIHFGANKMDFFAYPDCRPAFFQVFQEVINQGTKRGVEGNPPKLITPLIFLDKRTIAQQAKDLNVPIALTFSCYDPTEEGQPCTACDACLLREEALVME